jgi:hypothetical protein
MGTGAAIVLTRAVSCFFNVKETEVVTFLDLQQKKPYPPKYN